VLRTYGILAITLILPCFARPQQAPAPAVQPSRANPASASPGPSRQSAARLAARSDLVLVPVIVTDRTGRHIPGLEKDAFRLEENGKAQNVAVFKEITTEKPARSAASARPDTFSNFVLRDPFPWRITIVVLDMINTPWMRQIDAKEQLTNYLLRSINRDEPMALFGLSGNGLRQLHPFTTDTKVLSPGRLPTLQSGAA
jgi:VWFA-related protein